MAEQNQADQQGGHSAARPDSGAQGRGSPQGDPSKGADWSHPAPARQDASKQPSRQEGQGAPGIGANDETDDDADESANANPEDSKKNRRAGDRERDPMD
jgi:hypothetical protein